jgi:hypothetical protein
MSRQKGGRRQRQIRKRDASWQQKVKKDYPAQKFPLLTCPVCGKKAYETRRVAERDARRIFPGATMRVYVCGQLWHLTSESAKETAARKDRLATPAETPH